MKTITSTRRHFAFGALLSCNETRAPVANSPNSAQLGGHHYQLGCHSPNLHFTPGPCSNVGMRRGTDRHIHTDTQTAVTTIHFASATPHAKWSDNVYDAVIMARARPLQEFTRFIRWMQTERQMAANPQTKPIEMAHESAGNPLPSTSTITIY